MQGNYFVYNTTNPRKTVLYTGVTNNLTVRLQQHYQNRGKSETFAGKYYCYKLVYYERYSNATMAIEREKEIKDLSREAKEVLIRKSNPDWAFLIVTD
ncbi:endonuclease [Adhaeribacter arboris]|uniref:Endonuclease n=1 Tax=Adhaeribacter arboris TaxID=2072846 RepID=A0A2T2YN53_9BACT|nr:GIY-YIG nuclease family protein [Adhaeribacter arboris]PSR56931.1 endonuclease [Adhaeribacter arboris]